MDIKEFEIEFNKIRDRLTKINEELAMLDEKIYKKHRIPELKAQLERAIEEYEKEYERVCKTLQDEYGRLEKRDRGLRMKLTEFNKEVWKQFIDTVKKYVDEGWIIEEVTIDDRWEREIRRAVGDDLFTNFRPEDRVIIEILPTKTTFKYRVLWNSGKKRGQITETRIYARHPIYAEVELVDRLTPIKRKQRMVVKHNGIERHATVSLMCPICYAGYGEIDFGNGEKIIKELPDCPHRDKLVPYGVEQKSMTIIWRYIELGDWNKEPIEIISS